MKIQMNKNLILKIIAYPILFGLLFTFTNCSVKEKYDKVLFIENPESSEYEVCKPYSRTVLLQSRKVITRPKLIGNREYRQQLIVKGNNLIAYYYYDENRDQCVTHGWYRVGVYLEFLDFQPQLERI